MSLFQPYIQILALSTRTLDHNDLVCREDSAKILHISVDKELHKQKMFGLGSPLAAPSLAELARVRSQEREKEPKESRRRSFGRGGAGTRARWPRPRWLQHEGKTPNAANSAEATL